MPPWLLTAAVLAIGCGWALHASSASAQPRVTRLGAGTYGVTYRPADAQYRTLRGEHFDLIYQVGTEEAAYRVRETLRRSLAGTDTLVGLTPDALHMPVVIDGFSDLSNGFVTAFPFKQEIEAPSIRRDELVARSSSWPSLVASHELVHAMHGEVDAGFGIGAIVRFFAPDAARGTNLTAPRGLVEGVAVYRESQFETNAGRLNAPIFTMKMRAAMLSDDPWSLTQMMEPPRYTQPFNRFYIGGAHAFAHWAAQHSTAPTQFFREAAALHNRLPVLGFGVGLWHGLGDRPAQLAEDLHQTLRTRYQQQLDALQPLTGTERIAGRRGHNYRRPYWLSDSTLVAYLDGYDVRAGFYRIDAATGERDAIRVQTLAEDRVYTMTPDTTALLTSRYVPDPWVPTQATAEAERVALSDGSTTRLTRGGHVFGPVQTPQGARWAIQNDGPFTRLARITPRGTAVPVETLREARFKQVAPSPSGDTVAVLVNVRGEQRVYRMRDAESEAPTLTPWFGMRDALVYDLSWGPDGRYLLFSSDVTGIPNAFAYDTQRPRVLQLSNVAYGALEPALSPDGQTVAMVEYQHERHELVRLPFRPNAASVVPSEDVLRGADAKLPMPGARDETTTAAFDASRPYQAWRHLTPRFVVPTLRYDPDEADAPGDIPFETLGIGAGLSVGAADPLQRWAYNAEVYGQNGRLWGSATVRTARWRLRPSLTVFDTPETLPLRVQTSDGATRQTRIGFEERGVSFGTRLPITLASNVYQTQAFVGLAGQYRQTRFFGEVADRLQNSAALTQWDDRVTLFPQAAWAYRLQRNTRDLVPNQGLVLRSFAEVDAWTDGVAPSRALVTEADLYLPLALRSHTGIRLGAGLITQNRGAVFSLDAFVPRGFEDAVLGSGTFYRLDAEVTQPLWFIDDGWTLVPAYAKALYGYGFAQTLSGVQGGGQRSSLGAGLGLQFRLFYIFNFDLRVGAAYRVEPGDFEVVNR